MTNLNPLTLNRHLDMAFAAAAQRVVSRFDPATGREVVLAYNTSAQPVTNTVAIEPASLNFAPLAGQCPVEANAPGSVTVTLPPFGFAVCAAKD